MDIPNFASKFTSLNLNSLTRLILGLAFPALSILFAGCASVSVANISSKGLPPKKLPSKIYVQEFAAPYDNFHVDRSDNDLLTFVKNERRALAETLVDQLTKHIAPAEILPEGRPLPAGNYWLIRGVYDRVNQGSRLLRTAVGFGSGGTKMETRVQIANLSGYWPDTFLTMITTGGSGMAPGFWAAFTPALVFYWPAAVANAGGASLSGISLDRNRTAREITATLSEYCFHQGLITAQNTRHPKKLGLLPALQKPEFSLPIGRQ